MKRGDFLVKFLGQDVNFTLLVLVVSSVFPEFDLSEWRVVDQVEQAPDEVNQYPFTYLRLDRIPAD